MFNRSFQTEMVPDLYVSLWGSWVIATTERTVLSQFWKMSVTSSIVWPLMECAKTLTTAQMAVVSVLVHSLLTTLWMLLLCCSNKKPAANCSLTSVSSMLTRLFFPPHTVAETSVYSTAHSFWARYRRMEETCCISCQAGSQGTRTFFCFSSSLRKRLAECTSHYSEFWLSQWVRAVSMRACRNHVW